MGDWLVVDMDQGVLRRERTRRAALAWCMRHSGHDKVIERHSYGPGAYSYSLGDRGGDGYDRSYYGIETEGAAKRAGFLKEDPRPLYPYDDDPYEMDPDVAALLDAGAADRDWGPDR